MIYTRHTLETFTTALQQDPYATYTSEAVDALFNYYIELAIDIELDTVAIRCDWSEYTVPELSIDFDYLTSGTLLDVLRERTEVITLTNGNYLVATF